MVFDSHQLTKRTTVFDAALAVFSAYGFRRTSMHDVAKAAGISRPALYLVFDNKEDLFRQLAGHRQALAFAEADRILSRATPFRDRFVQAVLAYEAIFFEPVSASPHGEELMDIHKSMASDDIGQGHLQLVELLAVHLAAELAPRTDAGPGIDARRIADLLMAAITGQKKAASSIRDFRQRVRQLTTLFLSSLLDQPTPLPDRANNRRETE
jgi:AcrR family transcriptional regulator